MDGAQFGPYLQIVVPPLLISLHPDFGLESLERDNEDDPVVFGLGDESSDDDDASVDLGEPDEDADDDGMSRGQMFQSFVDEKETCCNCLTELAHHCHRHFTPFLRESWDLLFEVVSFDDANVRKAAVTALGAFIIIAPQLDEPSLAEKEKLIGQVLVLRCF